MENSKELILKSTGMSDHRGESPPLRKLTTFVIMCLLCRLSDACSSRSSPKLRTPPPAPPVPLGPTNRPNITFETYACPPQYATWYCLNGATCFTLKIGEAILYNCECADGYLGERCEFKDLDGSYLPSREKVLLETASIAGGAVVAILLVVVICVCVYTYQKQKRKEKLLLNPENQRYRPFHRFVSHRSDFSGRLYINRADHDIERRNSSGSVHVL